MAYIPDRNDLLDYTKVELVDFCDELIQALTNSKTLEDVFPDEDDDNE